MANARLTIAQVEDVLRRAIDIDAGLPENGVSYSDLERVAAELGISAGALRLAAAGHRSAGEGSAGGLIGPDRVAGLRWVHRPAARVDVELTRLLERRHLDLVACGGEWAVWEQRRAWWPDQRRISSRVRVDASVIAHRGETLVRIEAVLGEARRAHEQAGIASAVGGVALLAALSFPLGLVAALGAATLGPLTAAIAYRRRLRLVEERLDLLLDQLG